MKLYCTYPNIDHDFICDPSESIAYSFEKKEYRFSPPGETDKKYRFEIVKDIDSAHGILYIINIKDVMIEVNDIYSSDLNKPFIINIINSDNYVLTSEEIFEIEKLRRYKKHLCRDIIISDDIPTLLSACFNLFKNKTIYYQYDFMDYLMPTMIIPLTNKIKKYEEVTSCIQMMVESLKTSQVTN